MAKRRRAFTLIELMVVVVLMALIAALLIPAAISSLQREEVAPSERITQGPPSLVAYGQGERRVDPRIVRSTVKVTLTAQPVLDGVRVQNEYRAAFEGTFVVENVDPGAETMALSFPFPPGTSEARNVGLSLVDGEKLIEPAGVGYGASGIEWRGSAAPGAPMTFVVTYETIGRDAFTYDVAGQGRTDEIHFEVVLVNAPEVEVPADSLTPSSVGSDVIVWRLERAVASRPIVVELPAGSSSLGKLILLFQLAAVGVLLFGAGFWYVSERAQPGMLDGFRWGDFFLLALNYSLFFVVFGVIVYGGSPAIALAAASLISLPLLMLHVSRVLDLRFALRSVLPLALHSLATVIGAVYLPQHRALLLLAAGIFMVAYVTATYRGFTAKRKAAVAERLQRAIARALENAPHGFDLERAAVSQAKTLDELMVLQARLHSSIHQARAELSTAISALDRELESAAAVLSDPIAGDSAAASAAHQAKDALLSMMDRAKEIRSDSGAPREVAARANRAACSIASHREALAAALAASSRVRSRDGVHCSACGSASDSTTPFCPHCGTSRAHAIDCGGCGAIFRVPVQVVKKSWRAQQLHCDRCGETLRAG